MYKVFFKCSSRGVLKIDGEYRVVLEGQPFFMLLGSQFVVEFLSYEQGYLPLCKKFNLEDIGGLNVVWWGDNLATIYLCPLKSSGRRLEITHATAQFEGGTYRLVGGDRCYILVGAAQKTAVIPIDFDMSSGYCEEVELNAHNYLTIRARGEGEYLAVFKPKQLSPCFEGWADRFEISKDKIIMFKNYRDMSKISIKKIFSLDGALIKSKVQSCDLKYLASAHDSIRIYAFLEAVEEMAYEVLGHFLTPDLMQIFKPEVLTDFFGNFFDIVENPIASDWQSVALAYKKGEGEVAFRKYMFEVEGGKIANAEEMS